MLDLEAQLADKDSTLKDNADEIADLRKQLADAKKKTDPPTTSGIGGAPAPAPTTTAAPTAPGMFPGFPGFFFGMPPPTMATAAPAPVPPYYMPFPMYYPPSADGDPQPENPITAFIQEKLQTAKPIDPLDKETDPVEEPVAQFLQAYFWNIHPGKDIVAALEECERPSNCDCLRPITINDEVKKAMTKEDRSKDAHMRYILQRFAQGSPTSRYALG